VTGGRSRGIVVGVAVCALMCGLLSAPASAASRHHGFPRTIVRTDGLLTVGQQETLTVKGAPPKATLETDVQPPFTAVTDCFNFKTFNECPPEPLFSVSTGSSRFKASRKGRASLTFVMPPGYEFIDGTDPLKSHPVYFTDGQTVAITVSRVIEKHLHGGFDISISSLGISSATVQVQPPAP
jgi:hypothetical protein